MKIIAKTISLSSVATVLSVIFSVTAAAGPFEDGKTAYNQKDYEQAYTHWRTAARDDHAESQFNLGYMYQNGQGVSLSYQQAIFWYQSAADLGFSDAVTSLDKLKARGITGTSSYKRPANTEDVLGIAIPEWTSIDELMPKRETESPAPKQFGGKSITDDVGGLGRPVMIDPSPPKPAYVKPAEYTAHMYFTGNGVEKSPQKAVELYKQAANNGSLSAQNQLGVLYTYGLYGIARSDVEAALWYGMAAKQGDVPAMYTTGVNYYEGRGVAQSSQTAKHWFEKAANAGYEPAKLRLKIVNTQLQRK